MYYYIKTTIIKLGQNKHSDSDTHTHFKDIANMRRILFSGQVVTGEIVMASESGCPIEHHRIPVDKCDHMYDSECQGAKYMPFLRAAYDRNTGQSPNSPREQVSLLPYLTILYHTIQLYYTVPFLKFLNGT